MAGNPTGVELKIATPDDQRVFRLSEPIQFAEFYKAKYPGNWHIEVLDGWNEASISEVAHITDGRTAWTAPLITSGFTCCHSRHVWLSLDPVRVPYRVLKGEHPYNSQQYRTIRLPKPGRYQVYVVTSRVFGRNYSTKTYSGKGVPVASENVLDLEVVN